MLLYPAEITVEKHNTEFSSLTLNLRDSKV